MNSVSDSAIRSLLQYREPPSELLIPEPPAWRAFAACAGMDPDLFFPITASEAGRVATAKAVCARCEVRAECLDFAIENNERFGVWGGLSVKERRVVRRERRQRQAS